MPIIVTIPVTPSLMSKKPEPRVTVRVASAIPRIAVNNGMNAAMSAPNATIITMNATAKPSISDRPPAACTCIIEPVPSTCKPPVRNFAIKSRNAVLLACV